MSKFFCACAARVTIRRGIRETVMKFKTEEVKELCKNAAENAGLILYDVEFKQGKNPALTVFIDKDGGVTLDDCERMSNAISDPLDVLDPTFGAPYTLNVSSPGADRAFRTDEDFLSHIDKRVEVKLYSSVQGKKALDGVLKKYDGKCVVIETQIKNVKTTLSLELKNVVKVSEYIEF